MYHAGRFLKNAGTKLSISPYESTRKYGRLSLMQTETVIEHDLADGVMVGEKVVSTFCRREDMRVLIDEKGNHIGYAHLPTGQLFTPKGGFSYERKAYPGHGPFKPFGGKGGMLKPEPNKAHIARQDAWERLLEEDDADADTTVGPEGEIE